MNSRVKIALDRDCIHAVLLGLPNVPGVAAGIFSALSERGVSVDMITQNTMRGGRSDLSFLLRRDRLEEVIPLCREISARAGAQGVSFATEVAAITVRMEVRTEARAAEMPRALEKIFSTLASAGANVEIINSTLSGGNGAQGPFPAESESPCIWVTVVCIVSLTRAEEGLTALREAFGAC